MKQLSPGLSGNQLKLIALITMTVDHMGLILFDQFILLRIVGRLAFPIFAWMIAEGCRHTRSMGRYLGVMAAVAFVCQVVYLIALRSLEMCIMVTFSLSVGLCWLLRIAREKKQPLLWALVLAGVAAVFFLTEVLPSISPVPYGIDYGFYGVMLPVALYLCRNKKQQLVVAAAVLCLLALWADWNVQWFALLALPLLALYNGTRGKRKLKWLFYLYYPAHLVVLFFVRILLLN